MRFLETTSAITRQFSNITTTYEIMRNISFVNNTRSGNISVPKLVKTLPADQQLLSKMSGINLCKRYHEELKIKHSVYPNVLKHVFSNESVCLVTQLTNERMDRLQMLLKHWSGCVSASVYVEESNLIDSIWHVKALVDKIKRTNIFIHFVIEQGLFFPVNKLRNIAQKHVNSDFVFVVDVDFMPSYDLEAILSLYIRHGFFNPSAKKVLVVPAFSMLNPNASFPASKSELLHLMNRTDLLPFHFGSLSRPSLGHRATNYTKWMATNSLYQVHLQKYYEPYYLINRTASPKYDERFLHRGYNKHIHASLLSATGFEFWVAPDTYLVHMPHAQEDKLNGLEGCVRRIYNTIYQQHEKMRAKLKKERKKIKAGSPSEPLKLAKPFKTF